MDCVSLYNNVGLISKISEEITRENAENCRCQQPHCRLTPPTQETPRISTHTSHCQIVESLGYIFWLIVWVYLHSKLTLTLTLTLRLTLMPTPMKRKHTNTWLKVYISQLTHKSTKTYIIASNIAYLLIMSNSWQMIHWTSHTVWNSLALPRMIYG